MLSSYAYKLFEKLSKCVFVLENLVTQIYKISIYLRKYSLTFVSATRLVSLDIGMQGSGFEPLALAQIS